MGDAQLGAHQIALQLFYFLALILDAVAIAGQVIVGRMLGGGDAEGAYAAAVRMIGWSVVVGAVFAVVLLPLAHVDSARVQRRPRCAAPGRAAVAVFRADAAARRRGVRARRHPDRCGRHAVPDVVDARGERRLHRACRRRVRARLGIVGVWIALDVLIAARLALLGARFAGRRWAVVGWG